MSDGDCLEYPSGESAVQVIKDRCASCLQDDGCKGFQATSQWRTIGSDDTYLCLKDYTYNFDFTIDHREEDEWNIWVYVKRYPPNPSSPSPPPLPPGHLRVISGTHSLYTTDSGSTIPDWWGYNFGTGEGFRMDWTAAVDGDLTTYYHSMPGPNHWVEFTLERRHRITDILIIGRDGFCESRLKNISVIISEDVGSIVTYTPSPSVGCARRVSIAGGEWGQWVNITGVGMLNIAEVYILIVR